MKLPKHTLAVTGILATLILGIPAVYFAIREKRPNLTFEILGDTNVFDIHRPVKDLGVTFKKEDIWQSQKKLRLITILIHNSGTADILKGQYDDSIPLGITVVGGQLVETPRIVRHNSEYLLKNLKPSLSPEKKTVNLQKVIFERGKFVILELLVLQPKGGDQTLFATGKIAGIESLAIVENLTGQETPSITSQVFYAGPIVHFLRALLYLLVAVGIIIVLVALSSKFDDIKEEKHKKLCREATTEIYQQVHPIFDGMTVEDISFAKDLMERCKFKVEELEEMLDLIQDLETFKRIERLEILKGEVEETQVSNMVSIHIDVPTVLIDRPTDGTLKPSEQAGRILPLLIKFLRENPLPETLLKTLRRRGPEYFYLPSDSDEMISVLRNLRDGSLVVRTVDK